MRRTDPRFPFAAGAALALALLSSPAAAADPIAPVRPVEATPSGSPAIGVKPPAVKPVAQPAAAAPAPPKRVAMVVAGAPRLPAGTPAEIQELERRARDGEVEAQVELAEYFASGTKPSTAQAERAVFWYRQAAERGDADASWALADLHRSLGDIVPGAKSDMDEAVTWYRRAAEQGNAEAMYDLGLLYSQGEGVPRDPVQAVGWFELAADAGIARALYMLGVLFEQGVDGAPDLAMAAAWYARAAEAGDATGGAAVKRLAEGRSNVLVTDLPHAGEPIVAKADAPTRTASANVPVDRAGVKEIQTRLQKLGFKTGKADGRLGKRTAAAIRAYQKSRKLPVDGRATRALLDHLRDPG